MNASTSWGRFNWFELATGDAAEAAAFYAGVVGWQVMNLGPQTNGYTLLLTPRGAIGGVRGGAVLEGPAAWTGYVAVEDVDAYLPRIQAAGGKALHIPVNVPGVLRFVSAEDPVGGRFRVYRGFGTTDPPIGGPGEAGFFAWHELRGRDGASALEFYADLFGWAPTSARKPDAAVWTDGRGFPAGAMVSPPGANERPAWRFYIRVEAIEPAAERVLRAGGVVTREPFQTAGGEWMIEGVDAQGAVFGLISAAR
jgi:hypothetical protein